MKNKRYGLGISVILSLVLLTPSLLLAGDNAAKPSKAVVVQKAQNLHVPFIANEGQVDDQVRYYAKTFSGTVYVTREGEIMYALPKYDETAKEDRNGRNRANSAEWGNPGRRGQGVSGGVLSCLYNVENMSILDVINSLLSEPLQCRGAVPAPSPSSPLREPPENRHTKSRLVVLKESLIGAKNSEIQGEGESATRVSYFKGNDPSQWKSGIATYNYANLGEVYDGITLKLKAHGNNVEKLFTVKPGASPDQIKISLSGVKECGVRSEELKIRNPKSEIQI